jgi:cytochrome c556
MVAELGAAGDKKAFPKAVIQLGETCKACHEHFRKPEKDS